MTWHRLLLGLYSRDANPATSQWYRTEVKEFTLCQAWLNSLALHALAGDPKLFYLFSERWDNDITEPSHNEEAAGGLKQDCARKAFSTVAGTKNTLDLISLVQYC